MPTLPTPPRLPLATALASAVLGLACSSSPSHPADVGPAAEPLAVRVVTVTDSDIPDVTEAGGVVASRTTAAVAARVMAPVRAVRVAPGDRVRAGQVLVELDGRDLTASARSAAAGAVQARDAATAAEAEVRAADAALTLTRATHDRIAGLHARKSATPQELDEAAAALAAAEARRVGAAARVREAAAAIDRTAAASEAAAATASFLQVTAPFDGIVTEKLVEPGNMATPGLPLVRVEDTRAHRLDVRIDESRIATLAPGSRLDVQLDGPDGRPVSVPGTVAEVSRAVDAGARAILVKIDLPATPGVRSGSFGRARIPGSLRRAITVPADALVQQGQVTSVFVAQDGIARLRLVRMRGTEVLAGLTAGESVVMSPPPGLTDGRRLTVGGGR